MRTQNLDKFPTNQQSLVYMNPEIQIEGGQGTLKDPKFKTQIGSGAIINPEPVKPNPVVAAQYGRNLSIITPTGVAVRVNSNPISRYNFAIQQFENECNVIEGIELLKIPICCPVAYLYDFLIYFYDSFFITLTCSLLTGRSFFWNLILLSIYVLILIGPYISIIQLIFSGIFFLFYCIGVGISCKNKSRLGEHQFTENMVPSGQIPFFPKQYMNQFYELTNEQTRAWVYSHPEVTCFQYIISHQKSKFMAYTPQFLEYRYDYINSGKMICFHVTFMILSSIGLVISVAAFPLLYGRR